MGKKPNPLQKFFRGAIKESIDKINTSKSRQKTSNKIATKKSRYVSTSVRVDVFKRDNFRCVFCGLTSGQTQLQIDHIIPVSKGGSNQIDNLQTLCVDCNRGKSDRILD